VFEVKEINETAIEYDFVDSTALASSIDKETNQKVLQVYKYLKDKYILDLIPTYSTLAVHFTSKCKLFLDIHAFDKEIKAYLNQDYTVDSKHHLIFVDYNGPDIEELCNTLKLTKEELIYIHTRSTYTIAMLGFKEFFPYLFGLDQRLNIPRRKSPRKFVKKGAVAIAAGQCGIYSQNSPGGWHILGYTDFDDFKNLKPSDTIEFRRHDVN